MSDFGECSRTVSPMRRRSVSLLPADLPGRSGWLFGITTGRQNHWLAQNSIIGIGKPSRAVPATPPCVRVRTRRFDQVVLFTEPSEAVVRVRVQKAFGIAMDKAGLRLIRQGP